MADLPVERTTAGHRAFAVCGLDYFGHVNYVERRSTKKAWGLLFTCMSSRSVHVEVVTSLSLRTSSWPSVGLMTSGEKLRLGQWFFFPGGIQGTPRLIEISRAKELIAGKRHTTGVHTPIRPGTGWKLGVDGKTGLTHFAENFRNSYSQTELNGANHFL